MPSMLLSKHAIYSMYQVVRKHFNELSVTELYDALQLREAVFQIEQACIYKDIDDKDRYSWHLLLYEGSTLVACARLLPKGISYDAYTSIGRVASHTEYRRHGYGRLLMKEAMMAMQHLFPGQPIKISAQLYLEKFYESFGFIRIPDSEPYVEDHILHIAMTHPNR